MSEFEPAVGWCAQEVQHELPRLRLMSTEVQLGQGCSVKDSPSPALQRYLRELANKFKGAKAVGVRREPVPGAYRVFFRQVGLDPDVVRTPIEAAVLQRMLGGGFLSRGLLEDVLLIALLDTGVPVWAFDAALIDGRLGIRLSRDGELLGGFTGAQMLSAGRLVVADTSTALATLFGELAHSHEPSSGTARLVLWAVQVPGVPALFVEEALWTCQSALQ